MGAVIMMVQVTAAQDIGYNQVHHQAEGRRKGADQALSPARHQEPVNASTSIHRETNPRVKPVGRDAITSKR